MESLGVHGIGRPGPDVATGQQRRIPLHFALPETLAPGQYELSATVKFSNGEVQKDSFTIDVLPKPEPASASEVHRLGQCGMLASAFGTAISTASRRSPCSTPRARPPHCSRRWTLTQPIRSRPVPDLAAYDILIIGKGALTANGPGPDLSRVRDGLKVIVFEQTAEALEKRLGFRVAEYGLRQVFPRVPDHPLLAGLKPENLHDWRGSATLQPPRLDYTTSQSFGGPAVKWCGIEVPHVWRCGNRGNVASVLIEKPARGDFLPILDGGFSLQYSPLMEYREGKGMVLFCQLDVTGRTEQDPAAETLVRNLLGYVAAWKPPRAARRSTSATRRAGGSLNSRAFGAKPTMAASSRPSRP